MLKSHSKPNANCFRITDENSEKKVAMVVIKLKRKSSWHPGPSTEGYFRPVSGTLGLLLGPRTLDLRQSVALPGGSAWWPAPCPHCLLNLMSPQHLAEPCSPRGAVSRTDHWFGGKEACVCSMPAPYQAGSHVLPFLPTALGDWDGTH